MEELEPVHPAGEVDLAFETPAGQVFVEVANEAMTPYGGVVPWAAFVHKAGVLDALVRTCPVSRTSPNASACRDVLASFMLVAVCDGTRFKHVNRLREDPLLAELLGLHKVVGDDTLRRFLRQVPTEAVGPWIAEATRRLWAALPERFILDWDSTVQLRYGHQEGSKVGYNPQKPGRPSHHPLLAVVAGTRLCPYYRWRPGNTVAATDWIQSMEECERWIGRTPWLNRGDIGFANEAVFAWHEERQGRPHFLFKLRMTKNVQRAIARLGEEAWQGSATLGVLQVADTQVQLTGWSRPRRVVITRRRQGPVGPQDQGLLWEDHPHEYDVYITSLDYQEANPWQVVELYRQRGDCENVFDELKNQWGFSGFCSRHREVTETAARLLLVTYNLWNLFLRLLEPARHVEARHGRRWFLFLAARMVRTGRQRVWKMAVTEAWWARLKTGYERVQAWLTLTAPQLGCAPPTAPPEALAQPC